MMLLVLGLTFRKLRSQMIAHSVCTSCQHGGDGDKPDHTVIIGILHQKV
jgi:hypothetical protein